MPVSHLYSGKGLARANIMTGLVVRYGEEGGGPLSGLCAAHRKSMGAALPISITFLTLAGHRPSMLALGPPGASLRKDRGFGLVFQII